MSNQRITGDPNHTDYHYYDKRDRKGGLRSY
jgi:hypothetical protein